MSSDTNAPTAATAVAGPSSSFTPAPTTTRMPDGDGWSFDVDPAGTVSVQVVQQAVTDDGRGGTYEVGGVSLSPGPGRRYFLKDGRWSLPAVKALEAGPNLLMTVSTEAPFYELDDWLKRTVHESVSVHLVVTGVPGDVVEVAVGSGRARMEVRATGVVPGEITDDEDEDDTSI